MATKNYNLPDGFKCNELPKLPDGTSAMFVRILDRNGVRKMLELLQSLNEAPPAKIDRAAFTTRIYAPDGDLIFGVLPIDERKKDFICRLHKEVFAQ